MSFAPVGEQHECHRRPVFVHLAVGLPHDASGRKHVDGLHQRSVLGVVGLPLVPLKVPFDPTGNVVDRENTCDQHDESRAEGEPDRDRTAQRDSPSDLDCGEAERDPGEHVHPKIPVGQKPRVVQHRDAELGEHEVPDQREQREPGEDDHIVAPEHGPQHADHAEHEDGDELTGERRSRGGVANDALHRRPTHVCGHAGQHANPER